MPSLRRTDPKKSRDGVWFSVTAGNFTPLAGPVDGELCVLVARWHSQRHRAAKAKAYEPHMRDLQRGKLDVALLDRLEAEAIAEAVLLGWANLTEADEVTEIPYQVGKAVELLCDPAVVEFRQFVVDAANIHRNFAAEAIASAEGNLPPSSSGSSAGARTNGDS
jgi:hypothetical protein